MIQFDKLCGMNTAGSDGVEVQVSPLSYRCSSVQSEVGVA